MMISGRAKWYKQDMLSVYCVLLECGIAILCSLLLDPNVRLTKRDSPEVVDPLLHRQIRSIVGCLSYLVNMTRPDLAFTYYELSKFVQSPGPVHLAAAERALAYL